MKKSESTFTPRGHSSNWRARWSSMVRRICARLTTSSLTSPSASPSLEHLAVLELYELVAHCGADVVDHPAALVVAVLAALLVEVVAGLHRDGLALLRAVGLAHVDGHLGGERVGLDGLEPHVRAVEVRLGLDRVHADALHQVALEGVDRREAVDHVVGLLVRGRVAQHEQRVQALDGGLGLLGVVDALGNRR